MDTFDPGKEHLKSLLPLRGYQVKVWCHALTGNPPDDLKIFAMNRAGL